MWKAPKYLHCWQLGFHKGDPRHPALVQCAPILVHRDRNRDFKRPGDPLLPARGINHRRQPEAAYFSDGRVYNNSGAWRYEDTCWISLMLYLKDQPG